MPNERFTELPVTSQAELTDIICAVQGYVSPTNLGVSVQQTLSQIFDLFQINIILSGSGNPNGVVAGSTYQFYWDTVGKVLYICTTTGTTTTAVWSVVFDMAFNNVTTTSASMLSNNTYLANNVALVTLTLPTTSSPGDIIRVIGYGSGGWEVAQSANQKIIIGPQASTLGGGGYIASTNQYDSIILECIIANTIWQAPSGPQGNITYA